MKKFECNRRAWSESPEGKACRARIEAERIEKYRGKEEICVDCGLLRDALTGQHVYKKETKTLTDDDLEFVCNVCYGIRFEKAILKFRKEGILP